MVVSMRGCGVPARYNGWTRSSTRDSDRPVSRSTRLNSRRSPASAAAGRERARSSSAASPEADPAAARQPIASFDQQTGRAAARVVEDPRASGDHRLPAVHFRHRQAPSREPRADGFDDGGILVERQSRCDATTSRVRSSSVGPSPPVRTRIAVTFEGLRQVAVNSRGRRRRRLVGDVDTEAFRTSVTNSELVSVRVGVSISLPTAMTTAFSGAVMPPSRPAASRRRASRQLSVDAGHRVIEHDPPAAGACSSRRAGKGFTMSRMRNSTKPTMTPVSESGIHASVINMPSTSSITTGPGIRGPEHRLGSRGCPDSGGKTTRCRGLEHGSPSHRTIA